MDDSVVIALPVSKANEGTNAPWWIIVDPRQNMRTRGNEALHAVASMITGPWFSREDAERYLRAHRYNFGKNAAVYCMTGWHSHEYARACKEAGLYT